MTLHQARLPLGVVDDLAIFGGVDRVPDGPRPSPIARALETRPCAGCGRPVVDAHDATAGAPVTLDPGPRAYFVIGEQSDGTPIVALTSNGLMPHRCDQSHGGQ